MHHAAPTLSGQESGCTQTRLARPSPLRTRVAIDKKSIATRRQSRCARCSCINTKGSGVWHSLVARRICIRRRSTGATRQSKALCRAARESNEHVGLGGWARDIRSPNSPSFVLVTDCVAGHLMCLTCLGHSAASVCAKGSCRADNHCPAHSARHCLGLRAAIGSQAAAIHSPLYSFCTNCLCVLFRHLQHCLSFPGSSPRRRALHCCHS